MLLENLTAEEYLRREQELLQLGEQSGREFVWVWETKQYAVVLGQSCKVESEVCVSTCQADGVPIVKRQSGGGTVVLGPGCMAYSLVLSLEKHPELRHVADSYGPILAAILSAAGISDARHEGTDLMIHDRKFSGCSQRRMRRTLLHHGTILYDFDLDRVSRYLQEPVRHPSHRKARTHAAFLTNVSLPSDFRVRVAAEFSHAEVVV